MSRIGKRPVEVPAGVEVKLAGNKVSVKGPKGSLERELHPAVKLVQEGNIITVNPVVDDNDSKEVSRPIKNAFSKYG